MEDSNEEQDEVEQHMKDISMEPNVVEEHGEERRETMWSNTRRKATYFSIIFVFVLIVVMNNISVSQHHDPNNKIQKKSMSFK